MATTYGTLEHNGKTYMMTGQSELTNRVFPNWWGDAAEGETYISEWFAPAVDVDGNEYQVIWQFDQVRGDEQEPDSLNWDDVYKVRAI